MFSNEIKIVEGLPDLELPDGGTLVFDNPNPNYNIWDRNLYVGTLYGQTGTGEVQYRKVRFSKDTSFEVIWSIFNTVDAETDGVKYSGALAFRNQRCFYLSNAEQKNYLIFLDEEDGSVLSTTPLPDGTMTYAEIADNGNLWLAIDNVLYIYPNMENLSNPDTYTVANGSSAVGDRFGKNRNNEFFVARPNYCRTFDENGDSVGNFDALSVQDGRSSFNTIIMGDDALYSVSAAGSPMVCKFDIEGNVIEQLLLQDSGTGDCFIFVGERLFLYYQGSGGGRVGEIDRDTLAFTQTLLLGSDQIVGFRADDVYNPGEDLLIATHTRTTTLSFLDISTFTKWRSNTGNGGYRIDGNTSNNRQVRN